MPERSTTLRRLLAGLAIAALTGAGLTALPFVVLGPFALFVFFVAAVIWFAGVFALAGPAWWLMGAYRITSRAAAMTLGAGSAFAVSAVYLGLVTNHAPGVFEIGISAALGFAGAIAGLTGWSHAYRKGAAQPETAFE